MNKKQLVLEILTGPLAGITLTKKTKLSKKSKGRLLFPWDNELSEPCALFFIKDDTLYI